MDTSTPAVVIYRGGHGALAIARTLGRLDVPVYLVAQEGESTPVWSSRYWRKKTRWDFARPEEESAAFLVEMAVRLRNAHGARPLLFTLSDWVAIFMERHRAVLASEFVFPQPERPIIHKLLDKWGMHLLATENGIPTPATTSPQSNNDVEAFVKTAGFPVVLKSADPYRAGSAGKKIIGSRRELLDEVDRRAARAPLNFVLQEYIPGGADTVWMCNGYFGSPRDHPLIFTGKKLRQVSSTGIASLAVCLPNETVESQTRRFMEAIGYRGCVGIGYRYDQRDGLYKLLDVNARVSGVFRLFAGTNNMDVVRACYLDLTGQEVPETALQAGRKWMLEDDLAAVLPGVRGERVGIRDWIESVRGVRELQWFAADDPAPLFVWLAVGTRARARARLRSEIGKSSTKATRNAHPSGVGIDPQALSSSEETSLPGRPRNRASQVLHSSETPPEE
jgi:predicted ATP-grasp superfamily ATP-dependent carboligase